MAMWNNTCPFPGDTDNQLLSKIAQVLCEGGGGGGGGGVTNIRVNGGAPQTGSVSLSFVTSVNGDTGPAVNLSFVTSVNGDTGPAVVLTTTNISEGTNLYFTNARVQTVGDARYVLKAGDTMTGPLVITPSAADVMPLSITGYSVTGAGTSTGLNLTGTWNTTGVVNALLVNITNTASNSSSNLFDFQLSSTSVFRLRRDGQLILAGAAAFTTTGSSGHFLSVNDANTASSVVALTVRHNLSAGVGANNIGAYLDWALDTSTTPNTRAARWNTIWTDATHATRTSTTSFLNVTSAVEGVQMVLGGGQVQGNPGTAALPTFSNRNDLDNGLYFPAADQVGLSTGGTVRLTLSTTTLTSTVPVLAPGGSSSLPGLSFSANPNTGFYNVANNIIFITSNAIYSGYLASGIWSIPSAGYLGWESGAAATVADVRLRRDAAGVLALSNTTVAAQTFRITETTDAGLANYSRLSFQTQAGNHLLRTEAAGTGTLRTLQVGTGPISGTDIAGTSTILHGGQSTGTGVRGAILFQQSPPGASSASVNALTTTWQISTAGHLLAGTDATYDIGQTGATRPRHIFASGLTTSGTGFDATTGNFVLRGGVTATVAFNGLGTIRFPVDGVMRITNDAQTNFTRLNFGGTTNSFNAIGRDAVNGFTLQAADATATWNDANTAASGTVTDRYLLGIATPTLSSTNATVTYTRASTLFLGGEPAAGTNVTITTAYALQVAAGKSYFGGVAIHNAPVRLKSYTVAGLPAGNQGDTAYVTDALAPAFLTAVVGGGAVVTPVFYDGTNWVAA